MRNVLAWMSCLLVILTVTLEISSINLIWLNQWRRAKLLTAELPQMSVVAHPGGLHQPALQLTAETVR